MSCYRCYRCHRSIHWSDMFSSHLCTDLCQSQLRSFCFQSITCQECWIVLIDCVHLLNDFFQWKKHQHIDENNSWCCWIFTQLPPNSWQDLTIPQGLLKQFDELNTGNWYGYWTRYKAFYRTITIKIENVEHHFFKISFVFFLESYLDVTGRIRAPGSKQPSSSFASLMPTLPLSYLRAGLIGLATLGCWSEAVRNLRVFLFCLWMSWSCFHLSLLTGQSTIWHLVFCQAWLPWANHRLLQAFLLLLLFLLFLLLFWVLVQ